MNKALLLLLPVFLFGCILFQPAAMDEELFRSRLAEVRSLTERGLFDEAARSLEGLGRVSFSPEALYYKAFLVHKTEKNPGRAIRVFRQALKRTQSVRGEVGDPLLEIKTLFYLSYALAEYRKAEEAEKTLNAAFSRLERMKDAGRLDDGQGFYMLAYCYARRGQPDLSLEYYARAIEFFLQKEEGHYFLAGSFFNTGLHYYESRNYPEAVRWWKEALAHEPENGPFREYYRKWYATAVQAAGAEF